MTGVLVVFLDDARWDTLDHMPWTREMARNRGITCTDARSNAPICVTARLVFHSGRLDTKSGGRPEVYSNHWGTWLQDAGWQTAMIGKWHLGPSTGPGSPPSEPGPGWHRIIWPTDQQAHYDVTHRIDGTDTLVPGSAQAFQQTEILAFADAAHSDDKDWFVFWGHNSPHTPFARDRTYPLYGFETKPPSWPSMHGDGWPSWITDLSPSDVSRGTELLNMRSQANELFEVDRRLKAMWDHLESTGQADTTTVIVTSDNGRQSGGHRIEGAGSKNTPYEEATVVPLVAWGPTIPIRQTITCPTGIVDVPATVLAIAGATAPHHLDGLDLRDIARHPDAHVDRACVVQITEMPFGNPNVTPPSNTICTSDWKLIHNYSNHVWTVDPSETFELYDLANDPGELVNLAADPQHAALIATLDARLDALLTAGT